MMRSGRVIKGQRNKFLIATKFGLVITANGIEVCGKPEYVRCVQYKRAVTAAHAVPHERG